VIRYRHGLELVQRYLHWPWACRGRRRRSGMVWLWNCEFLVSSFLSPLRLELQVVQQMRRLSAWRLEADVRQEAASLALRV